MHVLLVALECIKTKGETREEPYLCVYIGNQLAEELGPWDMRRGDTKWINRYFEGETVRIILSEEDQGAFKDERYGGVEITENSEVENAIRDEHGRFVVNLPHGCTTRYKLYFDTRSDDDRWHIERHCLDLVSIECRDAQEKSDEIIIKVNGERVWGPRAMETGDVLQLNDVDSISIPDVTSIQLWEEDSRRDDFFGELRLQIDENFNFDDTLPREFYRDRGIGGDARYILRYRVRQKPWSPVTGWGRCRN